MSIIEGGNAMTESRFSVVHVRMTSDRTFADVQAAFEWLLGRFEPDVNRSLAEGVEPAAVRAWLVAVHCQALDTMFGTRRRS
jgi:hypothetical protein